MARLSVNAPCPCGSGTKLKRCCGRYHRGAAAPTPEALMRSRFSAYAVGDVDYVLATTHPDGPHHGRYGQREEVAAFCRNTDFRGLTVREARSEGDRGEVAFWAELTQSDQDASFGERSLFYRVDGRWLYHSGERLPA